jgi:murein DD-endopeptidase MepM/ murein hydrolase activator NlpD
VTPEQTFAIVHALKGVFDFRNARPGDAWRVKLDPDGRLLFFEYERSLLESYCVTRDGEDLVGYRKEIPVSHDVVLVRGKVHSSLYESMIRAGERPGLALMLADVLAWDIDFYRDPRPGDTFKIIVEKETYKGHTLRYGKILAAEYRGAVGRYRVFRYPSPTGGEAFYDENGHSAQKALLKAPVKLVRVTSTYGRRHHPILGYTKMHLGVDYGAPIGTPVWAVGDGTVIWAGRKGPNGNLIGLRHSNGYTTWYAHLSRIKVRRGQRVHQKDIIGLVGSTGRSTGPHLHYGVKKDGRFVNPLTLKLPPRRPLPARMLPEFKKHIEPLLRWLETPGQVAMLRAPLGDARR